MVGSSSSAGPLRSRGSLGAARMLGVAASGIALVASVGVTLVGGVFIGLACQGCKMPDGDGLFYSLAVTFLVGAVGFVGVFVVGGRARVLAGVEAAAAACMIVALVFLAFDGGDIHLDDSRVSVRFLYLVFALIASLYICGSLLALRSRRARVDPLA